MTTEAREKIHGLRAGAVAVRLDCVAMLVRLARNAPTPELREESAREAFHDLTEAQRELAAEDDPFGHFGGQLARIPDLIDAALDLAH